jgi:hypothetical protein
MDWKFDCPESGEKCNRPDCSIKYCADSKDLEARDNDRARVPREKKEVEPPDWQATLVLKQIITDLIGEDPSLLPRIARRPASGQREKLETERQ